MKIPNTLSPIEAAVQLNTSVKRVLEMIASGEIKAINTSKGSVRPRWAIPQESITALSKPAAVAPVLDVPQHV